MLLLVAGVLGLVLLVYLALRLLTTRRPTVTPPRPPDDDEDFLRDLRRRMKDPGEE